VTLGAESSLAIRSISTPEASADRFVHLVGLASAAIGVAILMAMTAVRGGAAEIAVAATYSVGLIAMLSFSTAFNFATPGRRRDLLRRFDHAAIFVMIAGTYTPVIVLSLTGGWAVGMAVAVWSIAAAGVALKLSVQPQRFARLSVALYLAFGWIGVVAFEPFSDALGRPVLFLIAGGGVVYSIGVIFYRWRRLPYQRAIWHGFVLVAASIHYAAVCSLVLGAN
jgi:hemolysin III